MQWEQLLFSSVGPTEYAFDFKQMTDISIVGLFGLLLYFSYCIALQYMKTRPPNNPMPMPTNGDAVSSEQAARVVMFDVSKTLSEVVVTNRQILKQTEEQTKMVNQLVRHLARIHQLDIDKE
jgi:hypothetical protein